MLHLLTNRSFIALSLDGIAIVKTAPFGRRIVHKQFYPLQESFDKNLNAIYLLFSEVLAEHKSLKLQKLQVVLSSDFIRFMVLPAQINDLSVEDKTAFAGAIYNEIYGALSDEWAIQLDDVPPHTPTLCAAIDRMLLDQFKAMAFHNHFLLTSIVPYATQMINLLNLKKYYGFLAIIEPSRLILMGFKGNIQSVQSLKWQNDWTSPLQTLMNKTLLRNGLSDQHLMIYAPLESEIDTAKFVNWNLTLSKPLPSLLEPTRQYQLLRGCV